MSKLGTFVRENKRPGKRAAQGVFDAVVHPRVASRLLLPGLEGRARTAGASDGLLERAASNADSLGVRSSIATYRLLTAVAAGDRSKMTPLLNKFKPDMPDELMWDALALAGYDVDVVRHDPTADLVEYFDDEIRRGFTSDGFSQVFEWLLTNGRVPSDSPALRPLLQSLVDSAVSFRSTTESERNPFSTTELQSVAHDLIDRADPTRFFLSGASLLAAASPDNPRSRFGGAEFATFSGVGEVLQSVPKTFTLSSRRGDHLVFEHQPTNILITVVCLKNDGNRCTHGDGRYTRWYSRFEVANKPFKLGSFPAPDDVDRYLDERFGQWRTPPFFYDPVLDAPNTVIDRSLGGLLFVYSEMRCTFASGRRHYADEWAIIMRDQFGIEYSNFVPQDVPRKVLATPPTAREVGERSIRLVVAAFDRVDAELARWLDEQCDDDSFVVAGVVGERFQHESNERLALANSLAQINHAVLIESSADLNAPIAGRTPDAVVTHNDVTFTESV